MSKTKNINFSRTFPVYHPKKGQETHFVEAILTQRGIKYLTHAYFLWLVENNPKISELFLEGFYRSLSEDIDPKGHTIREHKNPLVVGDFINPTCWAGAHLTPPQRPCHNTEEGYFKIKFAPDIEVVKTWEFSSYSDSEIRGKILLNGKQVTARQIIEISNNDGLYINDFFDWFNKPFSGQIICWNKYIEYYWMELPKPILTN